MRRCIGSPMVAAVAAVGGVVGWFGWVVSLYTNDMCESAISTAHVFEHYINIPFRLYPVPNAASSIARCPRRAASGRCWPTHWTCGRAARRWRSARRTTTRPTSGWCLPGECAKRFGLSLGPEAGRPDGFANRRRTQKTDVFNWQCGLDIWVFGIICALLRSTEWMPYVDGGAKTLELKSQRHQGMISMGYTPERWMNKWNTYFANIWSTINKGFSILSSASLLTEGFNKTFFRQG